MNLEELIILVNLTTRPFYDWISLPGCIQIYLLQGSLYVFGE